MFLKILNNLPINVLSIYASPLFLIHPLASVANVELLKQQNHNYSDFTPVGFFKISNETVTVPDKWSFVTCRTPPSSPTGIGREGGALTYNNLMTFQSAISSNVIGIPGILVCIVVRLHIGLPPAP